MHVVLLWWPNGETPRSDINNINCIEINQLQHRIRTTWSDITTHISFAKSYTWQWKIVQNSFYRTVWNDPTRTHPTWTVDRSLSNVQWWSKWTCQYVRTWEKRKKDDEWFQYCLIQYLRYCMCYRPTLPFRSPVYSILDYITSPDTSFTEFLHFLDHWTYSATPAEITCCGCVIISKSTAVT